MSTQPLGAFDPGGLPLNAVAFWRRQEALEEARARRDEAERAARAEERHERLVDAAMRAAWAAGVPFDPSAPGNLAMSHEQVTAQVSAEWDREDARQAIQDLVGGGRGGFINVNGPLMKRHDPDPSETPVEKMTPAQRAQAAYDAAEDRARVSRTAVNESARSINRRIHNEREHARRVEKERRRDEALQVAQEAMAE